MFGLAHMVHSIVRRGRLYLHRTIQYILFFAVILCLFLSQHAQEHYQKILCYVVSVILVGCIIYLEYRWLKLLRMPIFGARGLPVHILPKRNKNQQDYMQSLLGGEWRSLWDLWYRYPWNRQSRWQSAENYLYLGKLAPEQRLFGFIGPRRIGFNPPRHILLIAPTRAGKGTMGLVPNLLMLPNPVVVIDPKGELARVTAARRGYPQNFSDSRVVEGLGQDVQIFDPFGTTNGLANAKFNPLDDIDPYATNAITLTGALARSLILGDANQGNDSSFQDRARSFIQSVILHILTVEQPSERNLAKVWRLISSGDHEYLTLLEEEAVRQGVTLNVSTAMEALYACMASNHNCNGVIASVGQEMLDLVPETRDGILFFARRELDFLKDTQIQNSMESSTFKLKEIFERKLSIYVCLPVMKVVGEQRRVMVMFLNLLLELLESIKTPKEHPYLIIDEFPALGYFEPLEKAMGLVKYRFTIWAVMQDISQMKRLYKEAWETFVSNSSIIALRVANPETAKWLSELTGLVSGPNGITPLIAPHELLGRFSEDFDRRVLFIDGVPAIIEGIPYMEMFPRLFYDEAV